jgi:mono/diheme cytochrome c family protein
MYRFVFALAGAVSLGIGLTGAAQSQPTPTRVPQAIPARAASTRPAVPTFGPAAQTALVKQYCTGCHSDRGKAGGLSLASFDAATAADHPVITEKMIRKLRAGMMPPAGARRPEGGPRRPGGGAAPQSRVASVSALEPC